MPLLATWAPSSVAQSLARRNGALISIRQVMGNQSNDSAVKPNQLTNGRRDDGANVRTNASHRRTSLSTTVRLRAELGQGVQQQMARERFARGQKRTPWQLKCEQTPFCGHSKMLVDKSLLTDGERERGKYAFKDKAN